MYNYNTNEGGAGAFIRDLVIKLIFVIILVLLLLWLLPQPNMQPFYDRIYTENITLMKDTAKSYYTVERLPVKTDDKVTMTLGEMVNKHLILNLTDKDGKTCSTENSYVEVTKLETEYMVKTYLSCGDEFDYVIEYIGCTNVCATCTEAEKVVAVTKPLTKPIVKVVTKPKPYVKPPVVPPVKPPVKPPVEPPVTPPVVECWVLYGKPSTTTISDWSTRRTTSSTTTINGITTTIAPYDTKEEVTEEASTDYEREEATVYSSAWISQWTTMPYTLDYEEGAGLRLLNLTKLGLSSAAKALSQSKLDLEADDWSYYSSSDYSRYVSTRGTVLYLANSNSYGSYPSASVMQAASLKSNNFSIDNDVSWNSSYKTYQVNTTAHISNTSGVTPYNDPSNGSLFYVPYKFTVSWNEPVTTDEETTTYYRFKTTVSYADVWVLKGSAQEATLIANGYTAKQTKTVTK